MIASPEINGNILPDLSICIVTYQARALLRACLESIYATIPPASQKLRLEIIIVDNGSQDDTAGMVAENFLSASNGNRLLYPTALIQNAANTGYTRPMNQALRQARGRYLMQLNPDTIILPEAIQNLLAYADAHPEAGICSPKVLNPDRSLQKPCKRGEPTPWAVITYFSGLSVRFPKNPLFGHYLLNHLPEDEIHSVAGVSGSCMLIRRQVVEKIGYLDEQFFAYQEDADYCRRARLAGWQVHYMPQAQIIHYGGQGGSRVQPYRSIYEWHRSYFLYYRKHLAHHYFFLFNWLYYLLMAGKLLLALGLNLLRLGKFRS